MYKTYNAVLQLQLYMIIISVGGAGIFIHARLLAFIMDVCFDLMKKALNYIHVQVPVSTYICLCT